MKKLAVATVTPALALAASPFVAASAAQEQCDGPDANFYYACASMGSQLTLTTFANHNECVAHLAEWGPSQQYSFFDEIEGEHSLQNTFDATCENLLVTHMMDWGSGIETLQQQGFC